MERVVLMSVSLVSVCIPACNEEKTITTSLESVLRQSIAGQLEVLVCSNGCTDSTEARVREVAAHDERVRILSTTVKGKPNAWNMLREASRGSRLVFMDGDVVAWPHSIELLLEALAQRPDLIGVGAIPVALNRSRGFLERITVPLKVELGCFCGRLYAVDASSLDACMLRHGFTSMPTDIICEDLWVTLIIGRRRWLEIPEARVMYQHPDWPDLVRTDRRNHIGLRQLHVRFPKLFKQGSESSAQRARRWARIVFGQRSLSITVWRVTGHLFRRIARTPSYLPRRRHLTHGGLVFWQSALSSKRPFSDRVLESWGSKSHFVK